MNSVKKYWAIFRITLINNLAYNAGGMDVINGMTLYSTMWYLMMAETIELSRPPRPAPTPTRFGKNRLAPRRKK
jgi:hypothetical protein